MNITGKRDSLIPKGDGCLGCPYYTFNDRGFIAICQRYDTYIFSDGFRGIKTEKCKTKNKGKQNEN